MRGLRSFGHASAILERVEAANTIRKGQLMSGFCPCAQITALAAWVGVTLWPDFSSILGFGDVYGLTENVRMSQVWKTGFLLVTGIAALKTVLVWKFAMQGMAVGFTMIFGMFMLFFVLTAAVAYLSFTQIQNYMKRQRKVKLAPGAGEPAAKETVILRNAADWGLSQAEADVAIFVAKGFSNSEIAEMRGCAIATVKSQLGRIYAKSGLDSRYQLIGFVTDEVCAMAKEPDDQDARIMTRKVLPLAGRTQSAA